MAIIKLQSSDGVIFDVDVEIVKCSVLINTMLEQLGVDEEGSEEIVPIAKVNSSILDLVIKWATEHKDDPSSAAVSDKDNEKDKYEYSPWDVDFLKIDQDTLLKLISAANFMDIKGLLNLTCKKVADMIKGKTPEQIRSTFKLDNDFSAAEEEDLRKENEWCEDKN